MFPLIFSHSRSALDKSSALSSSLIETDSDSSHSEFTNSSTSQSVVGQSTTGPSRSTSFNAGTIWSSPTTLAFHPTGSASSCGSLFSGSGGGSHYHHHNQNDLRGAAGAMALYKSNPYAMNGIAAITSSDLLHSGYPGESLLKTDREIYSDQQQF